MKFFVLTRRKLITLGASLAACALIAVLSVQGILAVQSAARDVETSASQQRKIPIYCVDREGQDKKIAISFDAAWGNEQTEELIDILARYNVKTTFFVWANGWINILNPSKPWPMRT